MAKEKTNEKELARKEMVEETVSRTDEFFRKNKKLIYGILCALLIIGLGIVAYQQFYNKPRTEEAINQTFQAEANLANEEWDLALNGDGNVYGFKQIIDEYGSRAGAAVYMNAGKCEYELGNYAEALAYYRKYSGKDEIANAVAASCIGDCLVALGKDNYKEALASYQKAIGMTDSPVIASTLLKAGVLCEEMGDDAKALEFYKTLKENYSQASMEGRDIDKYISRIESKTAE